jgi:hypothetical protein
MFIVPYLQHHDFYSREIYKTIHLATTAHAPQSLLVWFRLGSNEGHFTVSTKYLLRSSTHSVQGMYLKLKTYYLLRMPHNWYVWLRLVYKEGQFSEHTK